VKTIRINALFNKHFLCRTQYGTGHNMAQQKKRTPLKLSEQFMFFCKFEGIDFVIYKNGECVDQSPTK